MIWYVTLSRYLSCSLAIGLCLDLAQGGAVSVGTTERAAVDSFYPLSLFTVKYIRSLEHRYLEGRHRCNDCIDLFVLESSSSSLLHSLVLEYTLTLRFNLEQIIQSE